MSTRGALEEGENIGVCTGRGMLTCSGWDLWLFELSGEHVEPEFFKGM